ncbi:MAG: Ankyrin repeats (3 copies) [Alphaproteobacteria bacterium ADurb.Bin438]|nr:MAG: Ankyrin repeats (3 copies) [Alphaproteobacteria bacterium ADurb.Bin438]
MDNVGEELLKASKKDNMYKFIGDAMEEGKDIQSVIDKRDDLGNTFLFNVIKANSLDPLMIMTSVAKVDIKPILNEQNKQGRTVLHEAALASKLGNIKKLQKRGFDFTESVDKQTNIGNTFIHNAALKGGMKEVVELIKVGLDVSPAFFKLNSRKETFLHVAAKKKVNWSKKSFPMVEAMEIIKESQNVNKVDLEKFFGLKNKNNETFFDVAAKNGNVRGAINLLKAFDIPYSSKVASRGIEDFVKEKNDKEYLASFKRDTFVKKIPVVSFLKDKLKSR